MRPIVFLLALILQTSISVGAMPIRFEQHSDDRIRLLLPAEVGTSWRDVNIGRLQVRSNRGQVAIAEDELPASSSLDISLGAPGGCSLIQVDVGPRLFKGAKGAWRNVTRCSKIIACAREDRVQRRGSSALVTGKTGSRIEIRPLLNPAALVPGSDLPVRLYWEGSALTSTAVRAIGPGGREVRSTSDGVGIAFLHIPTSGRWSLSFAHRGALAELIFDVP